MQAIQLNLLFPDKIYNEGGASLNESIVDGADKEFMKMMDLILMSDNNDK